MQIVVTSKGSSQKKLTFTKVYQKRIYNKEMSNFWKAALTGTDGVFTEDQVASIAACSWFGGFSFSSKQ